MSDEELEAFLNYLLFDIDGLYLGGEMKNKNSRKYKFSTLIGIINKKILAIEKENSLKDEN